LQRDPRVVDGLWQAVLENDLDKVGQMIARGAEIDRQFIAGKTPLMGAAENGHTDIVRYLLNHGCKTDTRDTVSSSF
jgi:ankyrin repeat protein